MITPPFILFLLKNRFNLSSVDPILNVRFIFSLLLRRIFLNSILLMKTFTISFILVFFLSFATSAQVTDGQEVEPTKRITESYEKKYLGEKLSFGWRKVGKMYTTTFQHKGIFKYCTFNVNGIWQEAGEAIEGGKIPENIMAVLPELDITAFLVESFAINTYNDIDGFMLLYETEDMRLEFVISDAGKIIRQVAYPIPEKKEAEEEKESTDVDWDDGK